MGKMIKNNTSFSTGHTTIYRYKRKTYIVQSSFMMPGMDTVNNDNAPFRLKNRFENILTRDPQLTNAITTDTICSSVDSLSARNEQ